MAHPVGSFDADVGVVIDDEREGPERLASSRPAGRLRSSSSLRLAKGLRLTPIVAPLPRTCLGAAGLAEVNGSSRFFGPAVRLDPAGDLTKVGDNDPVAA